MHQISWLPGFVLLSIGAIFSGCATGHIHREPQELKKIFSEMCAPGSTVSETKGSTWIKVSTTEESGQFPAQFHAKSPGTLDIEATNLVGSVEAYIHVRDDHYTVKWTGKESVEEEGTGAWRGIPLDAAVGFFLGKIPCPPLEAASGGENHPDVKLISEDNGDVTATVRYESASPPIFEKYTYRFKSWGGKALAETLAWKREGGSEPQEASFNFEAPDDATSSPMRVTAHSSLGEVKIRWKERRRVH